MLAFERRHFIGQRFDCRTDVYSVALVRVDEIHRSLGIVFIELGLVRQAHGDELVAAVTRALAQFTHGALGQQAGGQGVDTAADAQHQRLEPGIDQAVLDEGNASGYFGLEGGVVGERRLNLELLSNLTLYGLHEFTPCLMCWKGRQEPGKRVANRRRNSGLCSESCLARRRSSPPARRCRRSF
ncbi:hypothetical protein D3C86_1038280 [compost metagenome]